MALIDDYITDLTNVQRNYQANWVLPYSSAYALAFERFQATLDSQKEFDKMCADLAMMAVTLGVGGGLAAMFGKAALGSVVLDQAVNVVCNRNMTRTFSAMVAVEGSQAGSFLAKESWAQISKFASANVKKQVASLVSENPVGQNTISNPQVFQNDLKSYLLRAISAAHSTAASVRDNPKLSAEEKDAIAQDMKSARLVANMPTKDVTGVRAEATKDLELALYMVLVMHSDYILETTFYLRGDHDGIWKRRVGEVTAATTDKGYGASSLKHSHGLGYVNDSFRTVEYDQPGSRIMKRINKLHNDRFKSDFQVGGYGKDEIARAEALSKRLQQKYVRQL